MNSKISGKKIVAVDLIDTLIERGKKKFISESVRVLKKYGICSGETEFYNNYRKRYYEYSMGNYENDESFFQFIFAYYDMDTIGHIQDELFNLIFVCSPPFTDADEFLSMMSQKYSLFLCSNYIRSWVDKIFNDNNWWKYFSGVIVSSEIKYRKPAAGFFNELKSRTRITHPGEIILIGDSVVNDYYGSKNAGIQSIILDRNNDLKHKPAKELIVVHSLRDAAELL